MQFLTFPVCHLELRYRTLDMIHRGFRGSSHYFGCRTGCGG
jgi:hypothetical protein